MLEVLKALGFRAVEGFEGLRRLAVASLCDILRVR